MNDITLNWAKITKVLPAARKTGEDRPYTSAEIAKLLDKCDQRGRVVILLMCSSGIREGAIAPLQLQHLQRINDIYKITVYKNDPEEYVTFCSAECTKAIDDYLEYRKRCGEILKPSAPLIRQVFNKINAEDSANPRAMGVGSIENIIYRAIYDSGIREKKNVVKGQKRVLHEVMQSHGLRKFFNTQVVIEGKMSPLYAEFMMGHRSGLAMESYVKPTVSQLYNEYMKVVDNVTINEENRLRKEVQTLKIDKTKLEQVLERINVLENKIFNQQDNCYCCLHT
jgi:integrase